MRRTVVAMAITLATTQVVSGDTTKDLTIAFENWMDRAGVSTGAIAVLRKGQVVATHARGMSPDDPMEMASLGKAITAVCVRRLVDDGVLSYDDQLGDLLEETPFLLDDLTIAELVTHQTGLRKDSTQKAMPAWLDDPAPRHGDVTRAAFARNETQGRGTYGYNNENYAVLGEVIARVSGEPYREVCADEVPGGAPSPRAGAFDAWGGWSMPVAEYAAFHARAFPPDADPSTEPSADLGGGARYGLGTVWREYRGGHNYWHFGALCFETTGSGAFAVSWQGEWGAVAAWGSCVDFPIMLELDGYLARVVFKQ